MNDTVITTANRSLYGELAGMLRTAWQRSAAHDVRRAGARAERPLPRHRRFGAGATLAAGTLLAGVAMNVGVFLSIADSSAIAAPPGPPSLHAVGAPALPRRADAVQAFRMKRYADAYGRFADLADEGDAAAALIALAMLYEGPSLFSSEWSATPGQLRRWTALAARDMHERGTRIAEHDRGE